MDTIIDKTKDLIRKQAEHSVSSSYGLKFDECCKVYAFTNERIAAMLEFIKICNNSTAVVTTSSGDHAFNLINAGVYDIDTFDINLISDYYALGLKRAMILKYSYYEFLEITKIFREKYYSYEEITQIVVDLLPYMDNQYRKFWGEIVTYYYNIYKNKKACIGMNLFYMLLRFSRSTEILSNYLKNEEEYNRLKQRISRANITFRQMDINDLSPLSNKEYNIMMFSNVLSHLKSTNPIKTEVGFNQFVDGAKDLLAENGVIFLNYFFNSSNNSYNFSRPDMQRIYLGETVQKESFLLVRKDDNK